MNRGKNRASLLGIAGGYLLYLAYQLFQDRGNPESTMTPAVSILFTALFVLAGGALIFYAVRQWQQSAKEEERQEPPKDDENSLK